MRNALYVLICSLVLACSEAPTPAPTGPDASLLNQVDNAEAGAPAQQSGPQRRVDRIRARMAARAGLVVKPAAIDPRNPMQMAADACAGHCVGKQIPHLMAAGASQQPIIPASWTVPAWYIDPSNSALCASDTNSGTAAACTGGCTGSVCTSGIGPLATDQELTVHRWGCAGNPAACPRLRQNTTITFLSSHTNGNDPFYFRPGIENGAQVIVQGNLGTAQQVGTGILANVISKNRATNVALSASVTGVPLAADEMIVNTTNLKASRNFVWALKSGAAYTLSQPLAPYVLPVATFGTEVDTWANGDTVTVYQPTQVNIVDVEPVLSDLNQTSFTNMLYLYQLNVFDPNGVDSLDAINIGSNVLFIESGSQRQVNIIDGASSTNETGFFNVATPSGVSSNNGGNAGTIEFIGGIMGRAVGVQNFSQTMDESGDTIIGKEWINTGTNSIGNMYLAATLEAFGSENLFVLDLVSGAPGVVYGTGTVRCNGNAHCVYPFGDGGAVNAFVTSGGITLDGQGLGCISQVNAGTVGACNTSATPNNLDNNLGQRTGCIGVFGGASFCNTIY